jgi:hypothetical protein
MSFIQQSAIQRIQVGLIGLVAVLLFISIANVVFKNTGISSDSAETSAADATQNVDNKAVSNDEPLAELGVAPSVEEPAKQQAKAPAGKTPN